jgi:hypothetical protein
MRALLDRHQADLLYGMQLLLEDRLGLTVYTPVGYEWFDEGYWRFGAEHLGRALADQYLNIDAKYSPCGCATNQHWQTFDPAHLERLIRCVTRDQFMAMDGWTHIVATVQDNQAGFARLAAEAGAKYVYQVGNTRQQVDWSLDPLALVSSEVPIEGRGVQIHQPFDHATTFRYREPFSEVGLWSTEARISSFVNLLPRIDEVWPVALDLQARLPEFDWFEFGIDCDDGNLHPVSAIADAMAGSAFGLHLKPSGDGFGHVIFNWAAVGRPLIGRASYYRGQMAERFWQDMSTCIDLDRHSPEESAALIRAVWADRDRHRAMCEAIRAEFDRIDWDAETEAVRGLLL